MSQSYFAEYNLVTLPTGRSIQLDYVVLAEESQQFFYGPANVTDYLTSEQKRTFPGYDVERANREASDAARDAAGLPRVPDNLPTSTAGLFLEGVGADLAQAAQGVRDFAGIGPENAGKRSPLFWTLVIVGLGFVLWQIGGFAWLKKKLTA